MADQRVEELEILLQATLIQAEAYQEEAEQAKAAARIYEDRYHKERQQRERSRTQYESLTKTMIAQIDDLGQNGRRFGSPDRIPELQEENGKLRQENRQLHHLKDELSIQLEQERQQSDELFQQKQLHLQQMNELTRTKRELVHLQKKNGDFIKEVASLKKQNQVLNDKKKLAESQSEASRKLLHQSVLNNPAAARDPITSQETADYQRQLYQSRAINEKLEKENQDLLQFKRQKDKLESELQRALFELDQLRKDKEKAENLCSTYKRDNEILGGRVGSLQEKIRQQDPLQDDENKQEEIDTLRRQVTKLVDNNKALRSSLDELLKKKDDDIKMSTAIKSERKQYEEERLKWDQERTKLLLEKANLEGELRELQSQHLATSKEDPVPIQHRTTKVSWSDQSDRGGYKYRGMEQNQDTGTSGETRRKSQYHSSRQRYSSSSEEHQPLQRTQSIDEIAGGELRQLRREFTEMKEDLQQMRTENRYLRERIGECNSAYSQVQSSLSYTDDLEYQDKLRAVGQILKEIVFDSRSSSRHSSSRSRRSRPQQYMKPFPPSGPSSSTSSLEQNY